MPAIPAAEQPAPALRAGAFFAPFVRDDGQVVVLRELRDEGREPVASTDAAGLLPGAGDDDMEQASPFDKEERLRFRKAHGQQGIVLDLAWKAQLGNVHVRDDDAVCPPSFGNPARQKHLDKLKAGAMLPDVFPTDPPGQDKPNPAPSR